MEKKIRDIQRKLYQESLLLRERVITYYRSIGDPDPYSGLPKLLQSIADKLNQEPADINWLKKHAWGIYHVVSDSYMKGTILGRDLYNFNDEVDEFVEMFERMDIKF